MISHAVRERGNTDLPNAEKANEEVIRETTRKHLTDDEHVAGKSRLQHDRHVAGVEQLDRVGPTEAPGAVALHRDLDPEALEVDYDGEYEDGGDEIHDVRELVTPERLTERTALVVPGEHEVEEGNERTLELGSAAGVDRGGGEGLPNYGLADVGGNEEGNARTETVPLLEELVEEHDNQGRNDQLDDQKQADTCTEVAGLPVESGQNVDGSRAKSNDESKD
jgi:hypothetical protein